MPANVFSPIFTLTNEYYLMKRILTLILAFLPAILIAQCPDCTPDETCGEGATFPTLCPLILPDATAGAYYETAVTFYMPGNIEDPDSGLEVELQQITVAGVTGLPFGMTYTVNDDDLTYFPSNGENYGCATLCGTPLVAGDYEVVINVDVTVIALGFEQSVSESFSLPLTVLPGEGGNSSFAFDNLFGCGEVTTTFEALIDGSPGITTYDWDFGNGNTGEDALPPAQTYTEPGSYTVTLNTTIQNYLLTSVTANDFDDGDWCGDIEEPGAFGFCTGNPDPYFVLADANGTVFTSSTLDNTESGSWNDLNIILNNPPYTITFWDEDNGPPLGSADDNMGTVQVPLTIGPSDISGGGALGSVTMQLEITEQFTNEEVVEVWPLPDPTFVFIEEPAPGILDLTAPDIALATWTLNGDTIQQGPQDSLLLDAPGVYQVFVSNAFGCEATSETFTLCPEIDITYNAGTQVLSVPAGFESYTWEFNGIVVEDATGNTLPSQGMGNYEVTITTDYGCEVTSEVFTIATNIAESAVLPLEVYPNPANEQLSVQLPNGLWELELRDLSGRLVWSESAVQGNQTLVVPLVAFDRGIYLLRAANGEELRATRVVLQR